MKKCVYLDHAATTPVDPTVLSLMLPFFREQFGNPMTAHRSVLGNRASDAVEEARRLVAELLGASADQIVFTSGGTESDNWVLKGAVEKAARERLMGAAHLVISEFEHAAVLRSAAALRRLGYETTPVKVGRNGLVDPDDVRRAMKMNTVLVSVMHSNNEIGTVQPIADIARIAHERGALMHTDAVQSAAHVPLDTSSLGVDFLSLSAHKFNGPKGVGALFIRNRDSLYPLLDGGEQEQGLRASTHNVSGIVGLGAAARLGRERLHSEGKRLASLRDRLLRDLTSRSAHVDVNGDMVRRLPQNLNLRIAGVSNEALLLAMNEAGIVAAGCSACGTGNSSHVLAALGLAPEEARSSIRLTLGYTTTEEDITYAGEVIPELIRLLRSISR